MNKKLFKNLFLAFVFIYLSINFAFAQTFQGYTGGSSGGAGVSDTYQNVSAGLDNASTTTISNTSTGGLADTARYIGLMAAAAIVTLVIFKLIEGAVLKGTYDNIYDQQKGNKIIQNAIISFLIFIFVNLLFSYINPDYGSWIFNSSTGVTPGAATNCSPITPKLTAYSPQSNNSNGNTAMEGGQASAQTGIDGKSLVRTLEDVRNGKSTYVTLAGDSSTYKSRYTIPSITYLDKNKQSHTLTNVTAYVHDTGNAFKGAGYTHFDIAIDANMDTASLNKEPFTSALITLSPLECIVNANSTNNLSLASQSNSARCLKPVSQSDLEQIGASAGGACVPSGPIYLRKDVAEKFKLMQQDAAKAGVTLTPTSGYRDDTVQSCLWKQNGQDTSKVAKPCAAGGNGSNHLDGTAVDISMGCTTGDLPSKCNQKIYMWLKNNASKPQYGFSNNLNTDPVHWSVSGS